MKRNRKLAVVICICLILSLCLPFFLSGCRKKKIDSEMSVYYLNEDRTGLVKAPYETGKTAKGKKMTDKEICGMAERFGNHRIKSKMFLRFRMKYLYKNVNCGGVY